MSVPAMSWGIDPAAPGEDMTGMVVWETMVGSDGKPVSKIALNVLKNRCPQGCLYPKDEEDDDGLEG